MAVKDLRTSPMMRHLLDAVNAATDIGEYGRLTVVMVARHHLEPDELVKLLTKGGSTDEQAARALVQQVEAHGYNPPTRERILEWQAQQAFPICPTPEDPDPCNVYTELDLPAKVFRHMRSTGSSSSPPTTPHDSARPHREPEPWTLAASRMGGGRSSPSWCPSSCRPQPLPSD